MVKKYPFKIPIIFNESIVDKISSPLWKEIINSIQKNNIKPVLKLVKEIDQGKEFVCLPHPFIKVDTYPFKSIRKDMWNYIFFHDSNNKNHWILVQCTDFINFIVSETYSGRTNRKSPYLDSNVFKNIFKIVYKNYSKKKKY